MTASLSGSVRSAIRAPPGRRRARAAAAGDGNGAGRRGQLVCRRHGPVAGGPAGRRAGGRQDRHVTRHEKPGTTRPRPGSGRPAVPVASSPAPGCPDRWMPTPASTSIPWPGLPRQPSAAAGGFSMIILPGACRRQWRPRLRRAGASVPAPARDGRIRRASSTSCTAGSGGSPPASPPRSPAARARHVEVAPGAPHRLVAAAVDEVGAEHAVAVAEERVRAVPLVHAEVGVEARR
jgi:hypothetical protein